MIFSDLFPWHLFCCRRIYEPAWSQSAFSHPHHFLWDFPPSCRSPPERECWTGHMWWGTWRSAVWVVRESLSMSSHWELPSKGCASYWGMQRTEHTALEEANGRESPWYQFAERGVKQSLECQGEWGAVGWLVLLPLDSFPRPKDFEGWEGFGWVERHGTVFRGIGSRVREIFVQILALPLIRVSGKLLNHPSLFFCVNKMGDTICLMGLLWALNKGKLLSQCLVCHKTLVHVSSGCFFVFCCCCLFFLIIHL